MTPLDRLISEFDKVVTTVSGKPKPTERATPGDDLPEAELSDKERRHIAGLMRINHAGEVSAQGLYQGQALTAKLPDVRDTMARAAEEENDHLLWCEQRLEALSSHKSLLNPIWYLGSFTIGALAGKAGDKWSLGFVAETEKQVVAHLDSHLAQIPQKEQKSRAVLEKMKEDELHHGTVAMDAGGAVLPKPVQFLMGQVSKIMTKTSYWC
jgi:ubiquinone biosynthesis monooxygenase Coq7